MIKPRRLFSILLAISIAARLLPLGMSAAAEIGDGDFLVADFTLAADISSFGFKKNTDVTYENRGSSACWQTSGNLGNKNTEKHRLDKSAATVDLSGMKALHILMYNEENVRNQMNILLNTPPGYFSAKIDLDWVGWKDIVIPLSDFSPKKNTTPASSWEEVSSIQFNYFGWGATFAAHSPVYFDSIWFESKPTADTIEIADAQSLAEKNDAFSADSDFKRLYASAARWSGDECNVIFDSGEYYLPSQEYLYQWIYSPEATGEEIEVRFENTADSKYLAAQFNVDWTGWKLVEMSTVEFAGNGNLSRVNSFRIMQAKSRLYFDRIWLSRRKHATIGASSLFSTAGKLPQKDAEIKLKLSADIATSAANAVKITADGNDFNDFSAEKKGTLITVRIPQLEKKVKYSISLKDNLKSSDGVKFSDVIPIEFSAYSGNSEAGSIVFKDESGNPVTSISKAPSVCAASEITAESGDNVTVTAAVYENGVLTGIESASGNGEVTTAPVAVSSGSRLNAWVVSAKYGILRSGALPKNDDDVLYIPAKNVTESFALNGVYQEVGGFLIDMSYTGAKRRAAAVMKDSSGKIILADEFYIGNDLQYLLSTKNVQIKQGEYSVDVFLLGESKTYSEKTFYISEEDEAKILEAVNNSSDYTEVLQLIKDNKLLFRVNGESREEMLRHIALVIFEEKTFGSFDEIHSAVTLAKTALEKLNNTDWSELDDFFDQYPRALGNSKAYEAYSSLEDDEKTNVCREAALAIPYESFLQLRDNISDIIAEYKKTGTFGSGIKPSVSGNSSGGKKEYSADTKPPQNLTPEFSDLENYEWARDGIYYLLGKSVIAMPADGKFRPADKVTRAEFIKMLINAMGVNASDKSSPYTDVDENAWYAPYFAAAKQTGIVTGYPDGSVAPNENIKRQDIAVFAVRALEFLGAELESVNNNAEIADISSADDYAESAIENAVRLGIMNGSDGGLFVPQGITSRAEAAVVISRLIKGLQYGSVDGEAKQGASNADVSAMPEYMLIKSIGVLGENDSIASSDAITRRELARVMYKISDARSGAGTSVSDEAFDDIAPDDADYEAIQMMCALGYMTASGGKFSPDEPIEAIDFIKAAVDILGYSFIAEYTGGYPGGYMNVASRLKLMKNGSLDSAPTINNEEFINLIYNVLTAAPAELSGVTDNELSKYSVTDDNTLLYQKFSVYKLTGLFEADIYSDILSKTPRPSKGRIIISGETWKTQLTDINSLVGHRVEAYIDEKNESVAALFSRNTDETAFLGRKAYLDGNRIIYEDEETGSSKSVLLSKNASLLYNGRQTALGKALFDDINGTVTAIDYDTDGFADVIKIYDYKTFQANNVSADSGIITACTGGARIALGKLEPETEYLIYRNGKKAKLADIKTNDIILYTEVTNPQLTVIYACDEVITGSAEAMEDEYVFIGGKRYYINPAVKASVTLGTETKFYMDFLGQIAEIGVAGDTVYGYLYLTDRSRLGTTVQMKIFSENNRWVTLTLADKVKLNDESKKASEVYDFFGADPNLYRQLIRYNVNDDAEIIRISTAKEYNVWTSEGSRAIAADKFRLSHHETNSKYHNANDCLGNYMPVSAKTKVFLIPNRDIEDNTDKFYVVNMSVFVDNRTYADVTAYNADETFVADALVIKDDVDKVYAVANNSGIAPLMIVTQQKFARNDLGNDCYKLVGAYSGSEKISFNTRDMSLQKAASLKKGDVVQLGIDKEGYIISIDKLYDSGKGFRQYIEAPSAYESAAFMGGIVKSADVQSGRMVVQCNTADKGVAVKGPANVKVYIYDTEENTVTLGAADDIAAGDMVFFGARYMTAQQLVIFR